MWAKKGGMPEHSRCTPEAAGYDDNRASGAMSSRFDKPRERKNDWGT